MTNTGGGAASVVDRLGTLGMETLTPDAQFFEALRAQGVTVKPAPIIDLTLATSSAKYTAVLQALLAHPGCDAVLAIVGSSAQFHPELVVKPISAIAKTAKPLVSFLTPHAEASLRLMAEAGVAGFRTPEACADALHAYFSWHAPQTAVSAPVTSWPKDLPKVGTLDEAQALGLFDALGVPTVEREIARGPEFEHAIAYPVAAKVLSPDILHKTEAGGVALGIVDRAAFDSRVPEMLAAARAAAPAARVEGVLVQQMVPGLAEAIVGYRHDELVGPVVMVGMGGQLAEIYRDTSVRCAPVDEAEALQMIAEVRGFALIRGYRNLPRGDIAALARAVAAVSRLALVTGQPVAEAEINPLIVQADGVTAVDGLAVLK